MRQGNFDFAPQRLGQLAVGQLALIEIDARGQRRPLVEHPQNAVLAEAEQIGQDRVGQAITRRAGYGGGHVGHAEVNDVIYHVGLVAQRGRPAGLGAAALVNGVVNEDRAGAHVLNHLLRDENGRAAAGRQNRADDDVSELRHPRQVVVGGQHRRDAAVEQFIHVL